MKDKINIIHQWLSANAPKILNVSLRKGAAASELDELEKIIGKKLPDDFRELYSFHDGIDEEENTGSLFYGTSFLSLEEIADDYEYRTDDTDPVSLSRTDPGIDKRNMFNPNWLCIGFDGSHGTLRIDLAPTEQGTYGQVIFVDEEYKVAFVVARSIAELMETYVADLQNGLYFLEPQALEEGHEFLMPDESIDIVNWYDIEKWNYLKP